SIRAMRSLGACVLCLCLASSRAAAQASAPPPAPPPSPAPRAAPASPPSPAPGATPPASGPSAAPGPRDTGAVVGVPDVSDPMLEPVEEPSQVLGSWQQ